jgi:hypothetical protein
MSKEQGFEIKYLRDIDKVTHMGKYLVFGVLGFALILIITSMVLYKNAVIAQKPKPYIMDKNGEIRKVFDVSRSCLAFLPPNSISVFKIQFYG